MGRHRFLQLGPLYTFDPQVFLPTDGEQKNVADLVLTIAVAANDIRDLLIAWEALELIHPPESAPLSEQTGQFGGLRVHIERLYVATLREFLKVLRDSRDICKGAYFKKLHLSMGKIGRDDWDKLVQFALADKSKNPIQDLILAVRHNVAFHYERKELALGYEKRFGAKSLPKEKLPFVSYGETLGDTRYFFADTALEMLILADDKVTPKQFWDSIRETTHQIGAVSYAMVKAFFKVRGYKLESWPPSS